MANTYLSDFPEAVQKAVKQALCLAVRFVNEEHLMLPEYADLIVPSDAEVDYTLAILNSTLINGIIYEGTEYLVARTLTKVADMLDNTIDMRDTTMSVDEAISSFSQQVSVPINANIRVILRCFARNLCAFGHVIATKPVELNDSVSNKALLQRLLDYTAEAAETGGVDYGQHNIGIIIGNIAFDIRYNKKLIKALQECVS